MALVFVLGAQGFLAVKWDYAPRSLLDKQVGKPKLCAGGTPFGAASVQGSAAAASNLPSSPRLPGSGGDEFSGSGARPVSMAQTALDHNRAFQACAPLLACFGGLGLGQRS